MTQQDFDNYIANVSCFVSDAAVRLSGSLSKGLPAYKAQWNDLKVLGMYLNVIKSYELPHIEDEVRSNYFGDVLSSSLSGSDTEVELQISSYFVFDFTASDSVVFVHNGDSYSGAVSSWDYSDENTIVTVTLTGDLTSVILSGSDGLLYHFRDNPLDSDEELAKNCLSPDEMICISNHINKLCGSCFAPDFVLTTNNDSSTIA